MYSIFTPLQFHLVCRDLANDNTLAFFDFHSSLAVLYGVVRLIGARKHKRLFIFPFQVLGISLSLSLSLGEIVYQYADISLQTQFVRRERSDNGVQVSERVREKTLLSSREQRLEKTFIQERG